ncbi:MAG: transposase [Actinobacteria bacterium]|nr:MAG: transposase [Actinomycetota bacterium]
MPGFSFPWIGGHRLESARRHLERVLQTYVAHYNEHRPHRALASQRPPLGEPRPAPKPLLPLDVRRRDRLGGLLHEYELAA